MPRKSSISYVQAIQIPLNGSPSQRLHLKMALFHMWKAGVALNFAQDQQNLTIALPADEKIIKISKKEHDIAQI